MLVTQRTHDLHHEFIVQAIDEIPDVILDVTNVQVLASPDARIENIEEVLENIDDSLTTGQRLVAEMARATALGVGRNDRLGDVGQCFLQADVGGHTRSLSLLASLTSSILEESAKAVKFDQPIDKIRNLAETAGEKALREHKQSGSFLQSAQFGIAQGVGRLWVEDRPIFL